MPNKPLAYVSVYQSVSDIVHEYNLCWHMLSLVQYTIV